MTGRWVPDLDRQTAHLATDASIDAAVRDLHARRAIEDLTTVYSMAVDDHDLDTVVRCFAPDGVFCRRANVVTGHAALRLFYRASMDRYGLTVHTPTGVVATVDGDTARGVASGHAELVYQGRLVLASFRYLDDYRVHDGRWTFAHRELSFAYAAPMETLHRAAVTPDRIAWPDVPAEPGDYPETFATWTGHHT